MNFFSLELFTSGDNKNEFITLQQVTDTEGQGRSQALSWEFGYCPVFSLLCRASTETASFLSPSSCIFRAVLFFGFRTTSSFYYLSLFIYTFFLTDYKLKYRIGYDVNSGSYLGRLKPRSATKSHHATEPTWKVF